MLSAAFVSDETKAALVALLRAGSAVEPTVLHVGVGASALAVVVVAAVPERAGTASADVPVGEKNLALPRAPTKGEGDGLVADVAVLSTVPTTSVVPGTARLRFRLLLRGPIARRVLASPDGSLNPLRLVRSEPAMQVRLALPAATGVRMTEGHMDHIPNRDKSRLQDRCSCSRTSPGSFLVRH